MMMNGKVMKSLKDLKANFAIDELVDCYFSGELEFFLQEIGELNKSYKVKRIPKDNALLLIRLYQVLEIEPEMSEKEIRDDSV